MARRAGRNGRIYIDTTGSASAQPFLYAASWSLDGSTDQIDVTAFGDSNKTSVAGLPGGSISFAGFMDIGGTSWFTAAQDGIARKVYLYPDVSNHAGNYFWTTGYVGLTVGAEVNGAVTTSGTIAAAQNIVHVNG